MTNAPPAHLAPIVAALRAGDHAAALAAAEAALTLHPADPSVPGLGAMAALQMGDPARAAALLHRQLALSPGDGAVRFNLASALVAAGDQLGALDIARDHGTHPRLARLAGYLLQEAGEPGAAAAAYRTALAAAPQDWESWNNLGNALRETGEGDAAIAAFEKAINAAPGNGRPELFLNLAQTMTGAENRMRRLHVAEEAERRFPGDHAVLVELGLAQAAAGDMARAEQTLQTAAAAETRFGEARLELGLLFETSNRLDELDALIAESEALGAAPELNFLKAWSLRRRNRFTEAEALADQIPETINPLRTSQLRAEIADRLGNHAQAFAQYEAMNRAAMATFYPLSGPTYRESVTAGTAAMAPLPAEQRPAPRGDTPRDPVFIVGSPRSGTTLLDTLLGAVPELQVFEEMPMLAQLMEEEPGLAAITDGAVLDGARARYFALAEELEGPASGRRIVDKMPLHLVHMPIIHRLFPQADIILVERHPADAVLSCFMANFTPNHAMRSYADLTEAALTYDAIFTNWEIALALYPLRVHRVRYERMIADLAAEMRPLLAFLGLEWRDDVLDNEGSAAKRGTVRTASYAQIGQPLYARAVGRWERYRDQLAPVLPILQKWIDKFGY